MGGLPRHLRGQITDMAKIARVPFAVIATIAVLVVGLSSEPGNSIVNYAVLSAGAAVIASAITREWASIFLAVAVYVAIQLISRIPFFLSTPANEWGFYIWFGLVAGIPFTLIASILIILVLRKKSQ